MTSAWLIAPTFAAIWGIWKQVPCWHAQVWVTPNRAYRVEWSPRKPILNWPPAYPTINFEPYYTGWLPRKYNKPRRRRSRQFSAGKLLSAASKCWCLSGGLSVCARHGCLMWSYFLPVNPPRLAATYLGWHLENSPICQLYEPFARLFVCLKAALSDCC